MVLLPCRRRRAAPLHYTAFRRQPKDSADGAGRPVDPCWPSRGLSCYERRDSNTTTRRTWEGTMPESTRRSAGRRGGWMRGWLALGALGVAQVAPAGPATASTVYGLTA